MNNNNNTFKNADFLVQCCVRSVEKCKVVTIQNKKTQCVALSQK